MGIDIPVEEERRSERQETQQTDQAQLVTVTIACQ